jgi:hypothetical protein
MGGTRPDNHRVFPRRAASVFRNVAGHAQTQRRRGVGEGRCLFSTVRRLIKKPHVNGADLYGHPWWRLLTAKPSAPVPVVQTCAAASNS